MRQDGSEPIRNVQQIGPGDWVKVRGQWLRVETIDPVLKDGRWVNWHIRTASGTYDMWQIQRYAKDEDPR